MLTDSGSTQPPYDGFAIRHFEALQNKTGLKCESFTEYKVDEVTEYNSFISELSKCDGSKRGDAGCKCNIGIGSFWETPNRLNVSFLPPHGVDGVHVVTHIRNTGQVSSAGFFIETFTPAVWVAIWGLFGCFTLLRYLDASYIPAESISPDRVDTENDSLRAQNYSIVRRVLRYSLKGPRPYRLRKAAQSTSKLSERVDKHSFQTPFDRTSINFETFHTHPPTRSSSLPKFW